MINHNNKKDAVGGRSSTKATYHCLKYETAWPFPKYQDESPAPEFEAAKILPALWGREPPVGVLDGTRVI